MQYLTNWRNILDKTIEDRSAIRLANAYQYVKEFFPDLPERSALVLAGCIVKALLPTSSSGEPQH